MSSEGVETHSANGINQQQYFDVATFDDLDCVDRSPTGGKHARIGQLLGHQRHVSWTDERLDQDVPWDDGLKLQQYTALLPETCGIPSMSLLDMWASEAFGQESLHIQFVATTKSWPAAFANISFHQFDILLFQRASG